MTKTGLRKDAIRDGGLAISWSATVDLAPYGTTRTGAVAASRAAEESRRDRSSVNGDRAIPCQAIRATLGKDLLILLDAILSLARVSRKNGPDSAMVVLSGACNELFFLQLPELYVC